MSRSSLGVVACVAGLALVSRAQFFNFNIGGVMPPPAAVEARFVKLKSGMKKRKIAARAARRPSCAIFFGVTKRKTSSNWRLVSAPICAA